MSVYVNLLPPPLTPSLERINDWQKTIGMEYLRVCALDGDAQAAVMKEVETTAQRIWAEKDQLLSVSARMRQASEHATHLVRRYLSGVPTVVNSLTPRPRRFLDAVTLCVQA